MIKESLDIATIDLSNGDQLRIWSNLDEDTLIAAAMNWSFRTKQFTARSLCDYINSKRLKGMTDHYAYTEEEYQKL